MNHSDKSTVGHQQKGGPPNPKKPRVETKLQRLGRTRSKPAEINYLAYEVEPKMAKTLQMLIVADKVAKNAQVVIADNLVGVIISFEDWKQVAHFLEWSHRGQQTRQLLTNIRISCGSIGECTCVYYEACDILHKRARDEFTTGEPPEEESDPEEVVRYESTDPSDRMHFFEFLTRGVFCEICDCDHTPVRPSL